MSKDGLNINVAPKGFRLPELAPAAPPKSNHDHPLALQPTERRVLDKLAEAWNAYLELSKAHPDQDAEFRHGIHALQHQIMARPTRRMLLDEIDTPPVQPRS